MHIDIWVAVAGLIVGFTVGLTGMGGGALMTPILVLVFKVQPLAAVSSDLVASMIMKPVGGAVHLRRGTVNKQLVKWLVLGSVPSAFAGVLILRAMGGGDTVQSRVKLALGIALLLAASTIVIKTWLSGSGDAQTGEVGDIRVRPLPTLAIGILGGVIVGMTSVGSGSLIIVLLLLLYPTLSASSLVGTDLIQAIPLVAAASLGHLLFGDFKLALTTSLLIGSIPGVYVGARVSARSDTSLIRPALVVVLLASGLKLLNVATPIVGVVVAVAAIAAVAFTVTSRRRNTEQLAVTSGPLPQPARLG
jgi:uncharacterized membrane protein YfcA